MASLSQDRWYQWYLRQVPLGLLTLPAYEMDSAGHPIIHYGEVFCRVTDCSKGKKTFTATNNLRTHVKSHEGMEFGKDDKGGRVKQREVDAASKWYKRLFAGVEPTAETGESASQGPASTPGADLPLPPLPLKKDGKPHTTKMREIVKNMRKKVPCSTCKDRASCCKNINRCDHFLLFDCGSLAPTPAAADNANEEA